MNIAAAKVSPGLTHSLQPYLSHQGRTQGKWAAFLSPTKWCAGYAPTTSWIEYPQLKLLVLPDSLVSWPEYGLESLNVIVLIHLLMKKTLSSCSVLEIVQYIQLTKNQTKPKNNPEPFGEAVSPAKLQAIRLHSRTLGEFKVSLWLLCEYLVSHCKPL